jgi:hypothetical protein
VAKAYRLLRTMLGTAVEDRVLRSNPCQIRGASTERIAERPLLTVSPGDGPGGRAACAFSASGDSGDVLLAAVGRAGGTDAGCRRPRPWCGGRASDPRRACGRPADHGATEVSGGPSSRSGTAEPVAGGRRAPGRVSSGPAPSALVFTGAKGAPMRRSNFQKHWVAAVEEAGVPRVHFHDLRTHREHAHGPFGGDVVGLDGPHGDTARRVRPGSTCTPRRIGTRLWRLPWTTSSVGQGVPVSHDPARREWLSWLVRATDDDGPARQLAGELTQEWTPFWRLSEWPSA